MIKPLSFNHARRDTQIRTRECIFWRDTFEYVGTVQRYAVPQLPCLVLDFIHDMVMTYCSSSLPSTFGFRTRHGDRVT